MKLNLTACPAGDAREGGGGGGGPAVQAAEATAADDGEDDDVFTEPRSPAQ